MRELLEHDYVPENIRFQLKVKPLWNVRLYLERVSVKAVVVRAVVAEFVQAEQPVVKVCAGTAVVAKLNSSITTHSGNAPQYFEL